MNLQMFLETVTDYQIEIEEFDVEFRYLTVKDFADFREELARLRAELAAARQWAAAWKQSARFHRRFEDYGPNNYRAMRRLDKQIDSIEVLDL